MTFVTKRGCLTSQEFCVNIVRHFVLALSLFDSGDVADRLVSLKSDQIFRFFLYENLLQRL